MIEAAFADALRCDPVTGQPMDFAVEALQWLMADSDYSQLLPEKPSAEAKAEFAGTFTWACHWLSLDPEDVRAHGLPRGVRVAPVTAGHDKDFRTVVSAVPPIRGIADIRQRWAEAHEAYKTKLASGWDPHAVAEKRRAARQQILRRSRERQADRAAKSQAVAIASESLRVGHGENALAHCSLPGGDSDAARHLCDALSLA